MIEYQLSIEVLKAGLVGVAVVLLAWVAEQLLHVVRKRR